MRISPSIAAALLLVATTAGATPTPAQMCAVSKLKIVGKTVTGLTKCGAKAAKLATPVDSACLARVQAKFTTSWQKNQDKGGCMTVDDAATIEEMVDTRAADVQSVLQPPAISVCAATKIQQTGKLDTCVLTCAGRSVLAGTVFDVNCTVECGNKMILAFTKADAKGACAGDTFSTYIANDAFVASIADALPPTPCVPFRTRSCYTGPAGTAGVGACHTGTESCNYGDRTYGACTGEVTPVLESCSNEIDDDCDGQVNEGDAGCVCAPGSTAFCYSGPAGTLGVGVCTAGTKTCNASGTEYDACTGEVVPSSSEVCGNFQDDDCDGAVDEDCMVCSPGATAACYTGPAGTAGVGICKAGTATCNGSGTGYGPCIGEVLPAAESCATPGDEDCDGAADEGCSVTYSQDAQPIFQAKCAPCHTTGGAGGSNFAGSYADSQLASFYCPGHTRGWCTLLRVFDGNMPFGCTGNAFVDAGNPACLNAAEQQTISDWILLGQLP